MGKMENQPNDDFDTELVGHLSLAGHYGIKLPSESESQKLATLWKFGSEMNPENPESALVALEAKLGNGNDARIDRAYRWVRLRYPAY